MVTKEIDFLSKIIILMSVIFFLCSSYFVYSLYDYKKESKKYELFQKKENTFDLFSNKQLLTQLFAITVLMIAVFTITKKIKK